MLEMIFEYGQAFSLLVCAVFVEGVVAAKSKTIWPGLAVIGVVFLLAIGMAVICNEPVFFLYMMFPVVCCIGAFVISRRNLKKENPYKEEWEELMK